MQDLRSYCSFIHTVITVVLFISIVSHCSFEHWCGDIRIIAKNILRVEKAHTSPNFSHKQLT